MAELKSILVTSDEKRILDSVRKLPEGKLKDLVGQFLLEFADTVSDPRCAEVQADGIPCDDPSADCEQCLRLKELLTTMRGVLPQHH